MIAGVSHGEFWKLTPDEIAMSIDAYIERQDSEYLRAGIIASAIANTNRRKGSKPFVPRDFMPKRLRKQTVEEQAKILQRFAKRSSIFNDESEYNS